MGVSSVGRSFRGVLGWVGFAVMSCGGEEAAPGTHRDVMAPEDGGSSGATDSSGSGGAGEPSDPDATPLTSEPDSAGGSGATPPLPDSNAGAAPVEPPTPVKPTQPVANPPVPEPQAEPPVEPAPDTPTPQVEPEVEPEDGGESPFVAGGVSLDSWEVDEFDRCFDVLLPPENGPEPDCGGCSEDLEACPVVTGVASVDGYYHVVSELAREAGNLRARLENAPHQALLGTGQEPGASTDESLMLLEAELQSGLGARIEGELLLEMERPRCTTEVQTLLPVVAECDPSLDLAGDMSCAGDCVSRPGQTLACPSSAATVCTSSSGLVCSGDCSGECQLDDGSCPGRCTGECEVDGSVECPGECQGELDASGYCTGVCVPHGAPCPGVCSGICELVQPSACEGVCLGECTYEPSASCLSSDQTTCSASASEAVPCEGACNGELTTQTPPGCELTIAAYGALSGRCKLPTWWVRYATSASFQAALADSPEEAEEFDAQMSCYGLSIAMARTYGARVESLLAATQSLLGSSPTMEAVLELALADDPDNAELACATERLNTSESTLSEVIADLVASAEIAAEMATLGQ